MKSKVLVVGLDGGSFSVLRPWMDAGHLPVLQEMCETGVHGPLESSIPPVTVPAWSSFMTGKNPGKHGIYEFFVKVPGSYQEVPVNANSREGKTLWEMISEGGGRVIVLNVPMTYPPHPLNGVMVCDFLTPSGRRDFTYPPSLVDELEQRFGPYPLYIKTPTSIVSLLASSIERLLHECSAMLDYQLRVVRYLLDQQPCDFLMLHVWGVDRIQHELYDLLDPHHPRHNPALAATYTDKIIDYYRQVDASIGSLMKWMGTDTTTFIVSDHGFAPMHRIFDLDVWLLQEGYLRLKQTPLSRFKFLLWKMGLTWESLYRHIFLKTARWQARGDARSPVDYAKFIPLARKIFLSSNDIDWARTRAYCKFGMGQIILNVRGREPQGIVAPGSEYEKLRGEIAEKLRTLRDPKTGQALQGKVFLREEIYAGKFFERAPDLTYMTADSCYYTSNLSTFTANRVFCDNLMMPGNHTLWGILIAKGQPLQQGRKVKGAKIVDLAPTVLYLLGHEIPGDVDGHVLREIILPPFLEHHPIRLSDEPSQGGQEEIAGAPMGVEDQADIIRKLQELGYLN